MTATATNPDPELTAYIQVPDSQTGRGFADRWALTNNLLIDLGRFMERTGVSFEVSQLDSTVLACVCPDHLTFTALRLAYGPFFIAWPRPSDETEDDPHWRKSSIKSLMGAATKKSQVAQSYPTFPPGPTKSSGMKLPTAEQVRRLREAQRGSVGMVGAVRAAQEDANRQEARRILASIREAEKRGGGTTTPSDPGTKYLHREAGKAPSPSATLTETFADSLRRFLGSK